MLPPPSLCLDRQRWLEYPLFRLTRHRSSLEISVHAAGGHGHATVMQALENRTMDSKREMDIMNALDEMKSLKSRQEKVDTEALLGALQRSADEDRAALAAEDEAAVSPPCHCRN